MKLMVQLENVRFEAHTTFYKLNLVFDRVS